jgi:hypothetical protein
MLVDSVGNSGSAGNVTGAIRGAAQASGASFEYLLATAQIESGLNPRAAASTSSAGGLYQFIDQTWLGTLKDAGPSLGYGRYADAITKSASGRYEVSDPAMRQEIMALRKDPTANAMMAGAFTQQNAGKLAAELGRNPSEGELYIAHFLGSSGAARLIGTAASTPQASAAAMFPDAAAANHSIFYDRTGTPRSVSDVYGELVQRYNNARADGASFLAETSPPVPPADIPNVGAVASANGSSAASSPSATDPALASATQIAQNTPVFHSLFLPRENHGGISPVVHELWGLHGSLTSDPEPAQQGSATQKTAASASPSGNTGGGLGNLYSDQPANIKSLFGESS